MDSTSHIQNKKSWSLAPAFSFLYYAWGASANVRKNGL